MLKNMLRIVWVVVMVVVGEMGEMGETGWVKLKGLRVCDG
jgi:hypothetical protein